MHRPELLENSDFDIIATYQAEYRGLVQYYVMAHNLSKMSKLRWTTETSLLKTLAHKHKRSVQRTAKKYKGEIEVKGKKYRTFEATVLREGKKPLKAYFGGIPLVRNPLPGYIADEIRPPNFMKTSQLIDRLTADTCEMCGTAGRAEVHHVRKLKDISKPGRKSKPAWARKMQTIRRKTLVVCWPCHKAIHNGKHRNEWETQKA